MDPVKSILTAVVGLLILASLIGYSGENIIDDVPAPSAEFCGVTKDSYSDVPGSGAMLDIEVEVSWDNSSVWIGIIDVETYDSLEKLGGNEKGDLVSCTSKENIKFVAGGPDSDGDSQFEWIPDGEEFHIMIGPMDEADDDDDEDDDSPFPPPFENDYEEMSFLSEFTVSVNYDASGGWGVIVILFAIEIVLVYATAQDR